MFHQQHPIMPYSSLRSSSLANRSVPDAAAGRPPEYDVASDQPSRFSLRTVAVILISITATGISLYRIRDTFHTERPQPNPYQEFQQANPEYAGLISSIRPRDYDSVDRAITKDPWLVNFTRPEVAGPPLMMAAIMNQPDLVELLIDRGAEIEARGRWGGTALHWAAWRGSAEAVEALIARGASVHARSADDRSTPLFWACRGSHYGFWSRNNHPAVVRSLLDAGAIPDVTNSDGYAAVAVASEEIAALLVQHGAKPVPPASQPTFGASTGESYRSGWGFGHGYRRSDSDSR